MISILLIVRLIQILMDLKLWYPKTYLKQTLVFMKQKMEKCLLILQMIKEKTYYVRLQNIFEVYKLNNDFDTDISNVAAKYNLYWLGIDKLDCSQELLELLRMIMEDEEDDWIGYFCYELDFGRDYKEGSITDADGEDIQLATVKDLYLLLTKS